MHCQYTHFESGVVTLFQYWEALDPVIEGDTKVAITLFYPNDHVALNRMGNIHFYFESI